MAYTSVIPVRRLDRTVDYHGVIALQHAELFQNGILIGTFTEEDFENGTHSVVMKSHCQRTGSSHYFFHSWHIDIPVNIENARHQSRKT